jgi:hypothetical protein
MLGPFRRQKKEQNKDNYNLYKARGESKTSSTTLTSVSLDIFSGLPNISSIAD